MADEGVVSDKGNRKIRIQPVLGNRLIQALIDAGIIPDLCCHVVIEAQVDGLVTIDYRGYGDERLVEVLPAEAVVSRAEDDPAT